MLSSHLCWVCSRDGRFCEGAVFEPNISATWALAVEHRSRAWRPAQMLDAFLEHPFFRNRHRQAPLLKERESFLNHLQEQGTSRKALRNLSAELLQLVRLLKLTETRDAPLETFHRAASHRAPHPPTI